MVDDKLAQDEAQRSANYEAIKSEVKSEVGGEIAFEAERPDASQAQRVDEIAHNMREKAVDEVVQTEREVERGRFFARISQIVDYVFFVIYGLLAIRLILEMFGAKESAGFTKFIKSVTGLFYAPFQGIVPSPSDNGFTLALPVIIAIVVYMLLHLAINGILRMLVHRKTTI